MEEEKKECGRWNWWGFADIDEEEDDTNDE